MLHTQAPGPCTQGDHGWGMGVQNKALKVTDIPTRWLGQMEGGVGAGGQGVK